MSVVISRQDFQSDMSLITEVTISLEMHGTTVKVLQHRQSDRTRSDNFLSQPEVETVSVTKPHTHTDCRSSAVTQRHLVHLPHEEGFAGYQVYQKHLHLPPGESVILSR